MALPYCQTSALSTLRFTNDKEAGGHDLGPEEVARILDLRSDDVGALAREGKLRARRMGTRWRFRRDDVLDYLARLSQIEKSI